MKARRLPTLGPGDQLERYRILSWLGAGGMGEVFLAHDESYKRVAVKVLHARHADEPAFHERFARESRLGQRLRHPNIAEVGELQRLPDGRPYLIMEYVDGIEVADVARTGLTLPRFVAILGQITDALAVAHAAGVIHRDLKPSNILVAANDRIKILDFGTARLLDADDDLTQTGQILATPSYMSPEQATGDPVDARSDVYSLGAVMWEMLVGRKLFNGRSFGDYVLLHATKSPPAPSTAGQRMLLNPIAPALDALVLRCLAKRPEDRFASAAELGAALSTLASRPTRAARRRWPLVAAATSAVALALTATLTLARPHTPPATPPAPQPVATAAIDFPPTLIPRIYHTDPIVLRPSIARR